MQNMKIILVRHGETIENKKGIIMGQLPGRLSVTGKRQAKQVAKRLRRENIDYCFSSDLKRAADTAREILKYHPEAKVIFTKHLRELCFGEWQGKPVEGHDWPKIWKKLNKGWKVKGGESGLDIIHRAKSFWQKIYRNKRYKDKTILIVTHGGILRRLTGIILKKMKDETLRTKQENTGVTIIDINNGKRELVSYNCTAHFCYRIEKK